MYIPILDDHGLKVSICYALDIEHGLKFKFTGREIIAIGGIAEINRLYDITLSNGYIYTIEGMIEKKQIIARIQEIYSQTIFQSGNRKNMHFVLLHRHSISKAKSLILISTNCSTEQKQSIFTIFSQDTINPVF